MERRRYWFLEVNGDNMAANKSPIFEPAKRNNSSPELWITLFIGMPILALYIIPQNLLLRGSVVATVLIGVVPLFAAALVQRLLRTLKWHRWVQMFVAGSIGFMAVAVCYYYALFPAFLPSDPESRGDVMAVYTSQSLDFGFIGALASALSVVLANKLEVLRNIRKK